MEKLTIHRLIAFDRIIYTENLAIVTGAEVVKPERNTEIAGKL
jgi:hypothetical protein